MTKTHFETIATIIEQQLLNSLKYDEQQAIEKTARALAHQFKYWNNNFDNNRFLRTCGIKP